MSRKSKFSPLLLLVAIVVVLVLFVVGIYAFNAWLDKAQVTHATKRVPHRPHQRFEVPVNTLDLFKQCVAKRPEELEEGLRRLQEYPGQPLDGVPIKVIRQRIFDVHEQYDCASETRALISETDVQVFLDVWRYLTVLDEPFHHFVWKFQPTKEGGVEFQKCASAREDAFIRTFLVLQGDLIGALEFLAEKEGSFSDIEPEAEAWVDRTFTVVNEDFLCETLKDAPPPAEPSPKKAKPTPTGDVATAETDATLQQKNVGPDMVKGLGGADAIDEMGGTDISAILQRQETLAPSFPGPKRHTPTGIRDQQVQQELSQLREELERKLKEEVDRIKAERESE